MSRGHHKPEGGRVLARGTVELLRVMPTSIVELGLGLDTADRRTLARRLQRLHRDGLTEVLWRQSTHGYGGQAPNVYAITDYGRARLAYAEAHYAREGKA